MSPKQKKLAAKAPPPNKLDEKDFKVLREEKAKGRGMGLQDEKLKPGKVYKAKYGKMMKARYGKAVKTELKADPTKPISSVAPKASDVLKKKKLPGRVGTALGIVSMMVPAAYAAAKQYKDYKAAKNRDEGKVKKMVGGIAKKYSDGMSYKDMAPYGGKYAKKKNEMKASASENVKRLTTQPSAYDPEARYLVAEKRNRNSTTRTLRKTTDQVNLKEAASKLKEQAGPGFNVSINTKSDLINKRLIRPEQMTRRTKIYAKAGKMRERDRLTARDIEQATNAIKPSQRKMGGGMMNKPMGYKHGTMVKARGCKLGRTRPTKMY